MPSQNDEKPVELTRRQLLQAAGGVTFLAVTPLLTGLFATTLASCSRAENAPPLPLFTALPYLQAGTESSKLIDDKESISLAWQTTHLPATFEVEYGLTEKREQKGVVHKGERLSVEGETRFNYDVTLSDLKLNKRYLYRVRMNGEVLMEGYFTTRKPRGVKTRFVSFGDNSCGEISDRAIAYYAYQARPDFVMNTGDNVYNNGLDHEYSRYFFPVYNADTAGQHTGAPLLRSVPFYAVMGNHDLTGNDPRQHSVTDFDKHVDGYAYFTNWRFPLNGPKPTNPPLAVGNADAVTHFATCAGPRFPNMANYSFDYGDAHFLCLDSNVYVDPTDAALQEWIAKDLAATDAPWKFVVYHHPAFNVGKEHYDEQHMRVLSPIMEKHGVDVVLNGHEHNYQRTRPLRFTPTDDTGAKKVNSGKRLVPGNFTIDRKFDGKTETKPDGIIHILTGAGGNDLYDPEGNETPAKWLHPEDNNADYVARMISDRHSLTVIDMDARTLTFTQIDEWGREIDRFQIRK